MSVESEFTQSDIIVARDVKGLDRLLLDDDVPCIQFSSVSVEIGNPFTDNKVGYVDHIGFQTRFGAETEKIATIDALLEKGQYFVHMLYTFRSVSRAIPMIVSLYFCSCSLK